MYIYICVCILDLNNELKSFEKYCFSVLIFAYLQVDIQHKICSDHILSFLCILNKFSSTEC